MNTPRSPRRTMAGLVLLLISFVVFGYIYAEYYRPVQVKTAPGITPTPTPAVSTTEPPTPSSTTSTSTPSATKKPSARPVLKDPRGNPTRLTITQRGKELLTMNLQVGHRAANGDFESDCGMAAWYNEQGWPKPGGLSLQRSLITGHMRCGNEYYEIDQLRYSLKGAILTVEYTSGDVVVAKAIDNATEIDKKVLPTLDEYKYNDKAARTITVTTCDSTAALRRDGHSTKNVAQRFVRVK